MNEEKHFKGRGKRNGLSGAPDRQQARKSAYVYIAVLFSVAFLLAGTALFPWTDQVFWAGAMAVLFCWNFYTISLFVQEALPLSIPEEDRRGASTARVVKKGLLLRTYLRLFITGFFVYVALVQFQASPAALAAGLSAAVTIIPLSLFFRR